MALVGGGGAGNIAGSNPAGTGTSLNYIGDHAYAYSGIVSAGATQDQDYTLLEFTTGNSYIVAQINFYYADAAIFNDFRYKVFLNDQEIISYEVKSAQDPSQNTEWKPLLIPSFSKITMTAANTEGSFARNQTATLTGRVYA